MVKEYKIVDDNLKIEWYVKHEDYLKVVEEKDTNENIIKNLKLLGMTDTLEIEKEMKGKDEIIKEKDERIENLKRALNNQIKNKNSNDNTIIKKYVETVAKQNEMLYEKSVEINKLEDHIEILKEIIKQQTETIGKQGYAIIENCDLRKRIEKLSKEKDEDTYTLTYIYKCGLTKTEKKYVQKGLLKEEYEEMYGMDSDNWIKHSLIKEVK